MSGFFQPHFCDNELSQDVRRKDSRERSIDEHKWISLDCRLYPELYETGFRPHTEYDLRIPTKELRQLLTIPKRLEHAFGFIKNARQLKAHSLLHKFYHIENHSSTIPLIGKNVEDTEFVDIAKICKKFASKADVFDMIRTQMDSTMSSTDMNSDGDALESSSFEDIHEILSLEALQDISMPSPIRNTFIVLKDTVRIVEKSSLVVQDNGVQRHPFVIRNDRKSKLSSLTVSVIFQGTFVGNEYEPAYLSSSLIYCNQNQERESVGSAREPLQVVNSEKKLGRLVIEYKPESNVQDMTFEVAIKGYSACRYSLVVSGKIMCATEDFLVDELSTFLKNENEIDQHIHVVDNINLDIRVLNKKVSFLESLCEVAEKDKQVVENDIDVEEYNLENDDDIDYFRQIDVIKNLEKKLCNCCRIILARKKMIEVSLKAIDNEVKAKKLEKLRIEELKEQNRLLTNNALQIALDRVCDERLAVSAKTTLQQYRNYLKSRTKAESEELSKEAVEGSFVQRSRACLKEIDRVQSENTPLVRSVMLHALPQLFPKDALHIELNRLLDTMLVRIIEKEEANHPLLHHSIESNDDCSSVGTFDSEGTGEAAEIPERNDSVDCNHDEMCIACNTHTCNWKGCNDFPQLTAKQEELGQLIMKTKRLRLQVFPKAFSYDPGHKIRKAEIEQNEILRTASIDADHVGDQLKLHRVDKELHDAHACKDERYIVTRALHNYDCLMNLKDAVYALEREHNCLVAKVSAREVMDGIIDWMDRGWFFGQPSSSISNIDGLGFANGNLHRNGEYTQKEQIQNIHDRSYVHSVQIKAVAIEKQRRLLLNRTGRTIKMSLFCLTLNYFQTYNSFEKQKSDLSGENDLTEGERCEHLSQERRKMDKEEENAKRRNRQLQEAEERARRGARRIQERKEYNALVQVHKVIAVQEKLTNKNASSIKIQKLYRGHLGRKAALRWKVEMQGIRAWHALCHASAIGISRYWRGHSARMLAARKRLELTNYIMELRAEEAKFDEDEYWASLKFGKQRRNRYFRRKEKDADHMTEPTLK